MKGLLRRVMIYGFVSFVAAATVIGVQWTIVYGNYLLDIIPFVIMGVMIALTMDYLFKNWNKIFKRYYFIYYLMPVALGYVYYMVVALIFWDHGLSNFMSRGENYLEVAPVILLVTYYYFRKNKIYNLKLRKTKKTLEEGRDVFDQS